jgi:hypothetical protein
MEADGAGLKRAASNDGKLGELDGTTLEDERSLGKKLTEWRRERSEGSGGKERRGILAALEGVKQGVHKKKNGFDGRTERDGVS